ncbi:MAG: hypothetical protein K6G11_02005 [Lachnospiraceae bacterium]|nr:hypothetical protein [Lachnospiraceae bacterium]
MNLKKMTGLLLCGCLILSITGCSGSSGSGGHANKKNNVEQALEEGVKEAEGSSGDGSEDENASSAGDTIDDTSGETINPDDIDLSDGMSVDDMTGGTVDSNENLATEDVTGGTKGVDVDLTKLSSTMVYSEVFNMVNQPDSYIGKIIRMEGTFALYKDEATKKTYFACIIQDATACCQQGIEFELTKDYKYPDDYPKEGKNIKVEGTFDVYEEDGMPYCTLRKAKLL